jgi:cyclophilin family peptidyl-prolyl cis-trans isomerase
MKSKIKKQLIFTISILSLFVYIAPQTTADEYQNPTAIIDTSKGIIKIELYLDKVPITVGNFVKLAEDGFYDGMIFHRIKDDFMIQAGNTFPDGSTASSPYGPIDLEIHEDARHIDGAISMARTSDPNSATSQFFICDKAQNFLDDNYAVFGVTIEGIEVVRDIADDEHDNSSPAGGGKPLEDIIINTITIEGYQEALQNLADQKNQVTDGTDESPGFELILLLFTIVLIFIINKKKRF